MSATFREALPLIVFQLKEIGPQECECGHSSETGLPSPGDLYH